MKVTRKQWILVTAACLVVAASAAQSGVDRPPGTDGGNWVPISDSAGILLTNVAAPGAFRLHGFNVESIGPMQSTGILMVKRGRTWVRVDLELPQPRVHPLN